MKSVKCIQKIVSQEFNSCWVQGYSLRRCSTDSTLNSKKGVWKHIWNLKVHWKKGFLRVITKRRLFTKTEERTDDQIQNNDHFNFWVNVQMKTLMGCSKVILSITKTTKHSSYYIVSKSLCEANSFLKCSWFESIQGVKKTEILKTVSEAAWSIVMENGECCRD